MSSRSIERRLANGRLHRVHAGVYVIGRPELSRLGRLTAAVLACGPGAVLSHNSAAELWRILARREGPIDVSVPLTRCPRIPGVRVHRRRAVDETDTTLAAGIHVTALTRTMLDLAAVGTDESVLQRAINEDDRLDLIDPEALPANLDQHGGEPGVGRLRALLDRETLTLTDPELERHVLPIAHAAGLSRR